MALIPDAWMPVCDMKRIICHWTGGGYQASSLDRKHYHILIEEDGDLVRGYHPISDNVSTTDGSYAAHTKGRNTKSIGITACCMAGADLEPVFKAGHYPMKERQWELMAQATAELAAKYSIPITPQTVLGHGEVEGTIGPDQDGKWDPMKLPWKPDLPMAQVGGLFRARVKAYASSPGRAATLISAAIAAPTAVALLNGVALSRVVFSNEDVLLPVGELASAGLTLSPVGSNDAVLSLSAGHRHVRLSVVQVPVEDGPTDTGSYVSARVLASALDTRLSYDHERNVIGLNWA